MNQKDHEYCLRCGRKLKNSQARELGYGKICYRKLMTDYSKKLFSGDYLQSSKKLFQ